MRYHHEKPEFYVSVFGQTYECDHPLYNRCTLFKIGNKGLAVIQQRFDPGTKTTLWQEIDPWLTDILYTHMDFKRYFDQFAKEEENGLYPTVTIRQIMWALKMKPLPKERWETVFDRKHI